MQVQLKNHIPALDGLRGFAALMVMWFHYFQNSDHVPSGSLGAYITKFNAIGQTGVDLFFVLSGFLITRILLCDKKRPFYFRNFYIKRSLRILPLYYLFLIYFLFIEPLLHGQTISAFSSYWWWFVYLQNIPPTFGISSYGPAHYWSLAIEEQFYFAWPLLVFFFRRRGLMVAALLMIVLSFGMRYIFLFNGWNPFYFTLTRLDALSLGTILAILEPKLSSNVVLHRKILQIMLVACISLIFPAYLVFSGKSDFMIQLVKYPIAGGFYFIFIAYLILSPTESFISRIFNNNYSIYLGGISYGLYVYHGTCFKWIDYISQKDSLLMVMPLSFLFTILIAHLSFKFIESPFLSLKKKLLKKI
jgi:peptidoglycan/LPS O-acetylase OafA/YrhL